MLKRDNAKLSKSYFVIIDSTKIEKFNGSNAEQRSKDINFDIIWGGYDGAPGKYIFTTTG